MRIVSQDGFVDFNYNKVVIILQQQYDIRSAEINDYELTIQTNNNNYIIGTYSTKEKALKVMKMIRKHKIKYHSKKAYIEEVTVGITYTRDVDYFYMPQDNEVE